MLGAYSDLSHFPNDNTRLVTLRAHFLEHTKNYSKIARWIKAERGAAKGLQNKE